MAEGVLRDRVAAMLPVIVDDLERMVAIPSVAMTGFPADPVHTMADLTVALLRRAGLARAGLRDIPGGYPAVHGSLPGPPGAPTVLLYAHYDVHPAGPARDWDSDPWTPTRKPDGRIYARGIADNKSGIAIHAATLRAFGGRPPVGVRVVVEGEEEAESHLPDFVRSHPELFGCDLIVVADTGSPAVGEPALTGALRGEVSCIMRVRALERQVHSGRFGGPVPDALLALARVLASLHDDRGDVAVAGCGAASGPVGTLMPTHCGPAPASGTRSAWSARGPWPAGCGPCPRSRPSGSTPPAWARPAAS
jgi:cysteinylglycine-S-conjugate dipeptidase